MQTAALAAFDDGKSVQHDSRASVRDSSTDVSPNELTPAPLAAGIPLDAAIHNLPAQPTPLVGRTEDILAGRHALTQPEVRLLTLTGPAGVGKTRLALGIADCVLDLFPDGVFLVELAPTSDPALVLATIAEAL